MIGSFIRDLCPREPNYGKQTKPNEQTKNTQGNTQELFSVEAGDSSSGQPSPEEGDDKCVKGIYRLPFLKRGDPADQGPLGFFEIPLNTDRDNEQTVGLLNKQKTNNRGGEQTLGLKQPPGPQKTPFFGFFGEEVEDADAFAPR